MASFKLQADVITKNPKEIEKILVGLIGLDGMMRTENGFRVIKVLEWRSAMELNRVLLSALRKADIRTSLRAEWTHDGTTERFFDYVPNGIRQA